MAEQSLRNTAAHMQALARAIDAALNHDPLQPKNGFVLLAFPLDGPSGARTNYVSNGERASVVAALKEIVARFEAGTVEHAARQGHG